jgi:F-type H+-transporting ATPase subunit delta
LSEWSAALAAVAGIVDDAGASDFLARPELRASERSDFVADICGEVAEAALLTEGSGRNFLRLIAENDRLGALPDISKQFDGLKSRAENKITVTLISASEVDSSVAERVGQSLQQRLGREVELELEVDATLMGGAIVKAEDMVIDGSVRSRLRRLADSLID